MPLLWVLASLLSVSADTSRAPAAEPFARQTEAYVREWYPRIDAILNGARHQPQYQEVRIRFVPGGPRGWAAWVDRNQLTIPVGSLFHRSDGYEGMLCHEVAHIAQDYPKIPRNALWISEGIADYIRHKYCEQDIVPALNLTAQGRLTGYTPAEPFNYHLQQRAADLRRKGYERSYTVASAFLYWLGQTKDPDIIPALHRALAARRYSPGIFQQRCGKPLDALWAEFMAASTTPASAPSTGTAATRRY